METNGISAVSSNYSNTAKASSVEQTLSVNDFLALIAAQLQNQDMMNPMADTEFISQLAQFTTLQIQQATAQITSTQFALDLMGKEVLAVSINPVTGEMERTTGVVEGVSLYEGAPILYVNGKAFTAGQIMTVGNVPVGDGETEGEGEGETEGENGSQENTPEV